MSERDPERASARGVALDLLNAVLGRKRPLDDAIAEHGRLPSLDGRDRAFARLLAATVLRRLGQIDAVIGHAMERPLPVKARPVMDVLRLGVCQLLFLDTPAHAAVSTSVDLARDRGLGPHKALINAVLRRLGREGPALVAAQDAARINTPDWLWESWRAAYGDDLGRRIAEAHLAEAPLDISVGADRDTWARKLDARVLPTGTLRRAAGGRVADLPGFGDGQWWVQDAAAALPVLLLGEVRGRRVIDLCAAPGGKTLQLASRGARVTAVERSERRLGRLSENLARTRLAADLVTADAARWRPETPADAVLLDAPCSATGTIRRHPDVARLKTPDDVAKLAETQARLLAAAVDMVRPGGVIVYCACSLEPEEGPDRIAALMETGAPVARRPVAATDVGGLAELVSPPGDLRTLPCHLADLGGMDAFYAARLERT